MASFRMLAYSFLAYLIVALLFDVTGWKSLFLNIIVMCLVRSVFNPKSGLKLKMKFSFEKRKNINGEGDNDNDDDHVNLHRGAAGTPEQAD
ncbi:hypothetical protein TSUD_360460 [Trifolium subterraneum]|uniref:Uncharacterized protein n=1 Tax=Trifolium subterraneum TaxID=3900 RepID=A0A2Z6MDJ8_TRISU|nr:hypothetical protein TSUD_360460 [Trifolium subterraneum]